MSSNFNLKVGQSIDAYDYLLKIWSHAVIIAERQNRFKIHWYGWRDRFDEWINKNDKQRLAPSNTHIIPITVLQPIPSIVDAEPLFYESTTNDTNKYILASNSCYLVHKYHIDRDEWTKIFAPDQSPENRVAVLNAENCKLCFLRQASKIINVDLESEIWTEQQQTTTLEAIDCGLTFYIIDNKLHIFVITNKCKHLIQDLNQSNSQQVIDKNELHYNSMEMAAIFYIPLLNRFLIFMYDNAKNGIFEGDMGMDGTIEWKNSSDLDNLDIMFKELKGFCLIFDNLILMTFRGRRSRSIWILDVMRRKWFKCNGYLSLDGCMVNTRNNYIHVIRTENMNTSQQIHYHYKFNVLDIMPLKLDKLYRKERYHALIFGFVKRMQNHNELSYNIPIYLKELILKYFSCFLYH